MEPPPGFVRVARDGAELLLRAGMEDALLAAGVAAPEALVARSPASGLKGRGALARVALPGGQAVLRLYRRGGLLGKLVRRLSLDAERAFAELALHATALERGGWPVVAKGFHLTLSVDHRLIDGVRGARFIGALADRIEFGPWS